MTFFTCSTEAMAVSLEGKKKFSFSPGRSCEKDWIGLDKAL
jgi:hypothetical protein